MLRHLAQCLANGKNFRSCSSFVIVTHRYLFTYQQHRTPEMINSKGCAAFVPRDDSNQRWPWQSGGPSTYGQQEPPNPSHSCHMGRADPHFQGSQISKDTGDLHTYAQSPIFKCWQLITNVFHLPVSQQQYTEPCFSFYY